MKEPKNVVRMLQDANVEVQLTASGNYTLSHTLTSQEFDVVVKHIMTALNLKPQHVDWCPGSPTGDDFDNGYYVCPVEPREFDGDDFNMVIQNDFVSWC